MNRAWIFGGLVLVAVGGASAEEAKLARPATLEEAAGVLDLASFPLLPGAPEPHVRRLASLHYEAQATVAEAYAAQKKPLADRGWAEQPGGYATDQAASGSFAKGAYRVSVTVFPAAEPGRVTVSIVNHGNVDTKALPVPPGAKVLFAGPVSTMFVTDQAVAPAAVSCRDRLLAQNWRPFGEAGETRFYKQNAVRLAVRVAAAPAQGGRTIIDCSSELLSADLPAPADTDRLDYADTTKTVSFDTKAGPREVGDFYRGTLKKAGWTPATEAPVKLDAVREIQFFRDAKKDLLVLEYRPVDAIMRASLRHYTAGEWEESERLIREAEAARKAAVRPTVPAARPAVALTLPAGATGVEAAADRLKFNLAAGKAKGVVQSLRAELSRAGWEADATSLDAAAGAVNFHKGSGHLIVVYVDAGLGPAEVTASALGATIEAPKTRPKGKTR